MKKTEKDYILSRIPTSKSQEFRDWYSKTFKGADPDDLLTMLFIWRILQNSVKNISSSIGCNLISKYIAGNAAKFKRNLCKYIDEPLPSYSKFQHKERRVKMESWLAQKYLDQWYRLKASDTRENANIDLKALKSVIRLKNSCSELYCHPLIDYLEYLNTVAIKHVFDFTDAKNQSLVDIAEEKRKSDLNLSNNLSRTIVCGAMLLAAESAHNKGVVYEYKKGRFYTVGQSMQLVCSEYRHLITTTAKNYYELDLKACHAAIVAAYFKLPVLSDMMSANSEWRQEIANQIGTTRDAVKLAVQATIYGGNANCLKCCLVPDKEERERAKELWDGGMRYDSVSYYINKHKTAEIAAKFLSHPAISELRGAIKNFPEKFTDAWGYDHVLDEFKENDGKKNTRKDGKQQALSYLLCSYEKKLLWPIIERAMKEQYDIILDQHDGMSIYSPKWNPVQTLKQEVASIAKELGIHTSLEVKGR